MNARGILDIGLYRYRMHLLLYAILVSLLVVSLCFHSDVLFHFGVPFHSGESFRSVLYRSSVGPSSSCWPFE